MNEATAAELNHADQRARVGAFLRDMREFAGMSMIDAAAYLGVTAQTISQLELGRADASDNARLAIRALAIRYAVNTNTLAHAIAKEYVK